MGQAFDVAVMWAEIAEDVPTAELPDCAHLPHKERPANVSGADPIGTLRLYGEHVLPQLRR